MNYLSLFSGIEAASVAWSDFGWTCVGVSEIDPFACEVLKTRYPAVPNLGDITKITTEQLDAIKKERKEINIIVGGSPCQSFSVAGHRKGLQDPRGNLMFEYCRIVEAVRPSWFIWENVPGALSSNKGQDYACLLEKMAQLGYFLSWRVLDAQFFGVPQRRRRVFLVGSLDQRKSPFKVLFEPKGGQWDFEQSGEKGKDDSTEAKESTGEHSKTEACIAQETYNITFCDANGTRKDRPNGGLYITETDKSSTVTTSGVGSTTVVESGVLGTLDASYYKGCGMRGGIERTITDGEEAYPCLKVEHNLDCKISTPLFARDYKGASPDDFSPTAQKLVVEKTDAERVRRLTPIECERLQGFPDNWTRIAYNKKEAKDCPHSHRYKCLGNSMAVPVMTWIGNRIKMMETHARIRSSNPLPNEE